ncbi:MAG: hypothetical protein E6I75_03685 [Chloroflexi bacterium]|nr:MAG: hypothetical protein E6I75_03685 [Chloroflexota bacterium]
MPGAARRPGQYPRTAGAGGSAVWQRRGTDREHRSESGTDRALPVRAQRGRCACKTRRGGLRGGVGGGAGDAAGAGDRLGAGRGGRRRLWCRAAGGRGA